MKCEWCCANHPAEWHGWTIYNVAAWMCTQQRDKICAKDAEGTYECVPAAERLAQMHGQEGRT